jgi:hypothetical protein
VLANISYPVKLGYSCDFFMLFMLFFMLFINIIYLCLTSSCKFHIFEAVKNSETYHEPSLQMLRFSQGETRCAKSSAGRSDRTGAAESCVMLSTWD